MRIRCLAAVAGLAAILLFAPPARALEILVDCTIQVGNGTGNGIFHAYMGNFEEEGTPYGQAPPLNGVSFCDSVASPGNAVSVTGIDIGSTTGTYQSSIGDLTQGVRYLKVVGTVNSLGTPGNPNVANFPAAGFSATVKAEYGGFKVWNFTTSTWDSGITGKGMTSFNTNPDYWVASSAEWNGGPAYLGARGPVVTQQDRSPDPPIVLGTDAKGAPRVWRDWGGLNPPDTDYAYFTAKIQLVAIPLDIDPSGGELGGAPGGQGSLSTRLVRTTTALTTLAGATTALTTLAPGVSGHYYSEVDNIPRISIDNGVAQIGNPVGLVVGNPFTNNVNGNPGDNTAGLIAGYLKVDNTNIAGHDVTFALSSDDGYQFKIGNTVVFGASNSGANPPSTATSTLKTVRFPQQTIGGSIPQYVYWPISATWFNATGGLGLEVSAIDGDADTFSTSTFKLLGDPTSPFTVYTRASALPSVASGANSVLGAKLTAPTIAWDNTTQGRPPAGDGLTVYSTYCRPQDPKYAAATAQANTLLYNIDQAITLLKDPASIAPGVGKSEISNVLNYRDPDMSFASNYGTVRSFPSNTSGVSVGNQNTGDDTNFATRMSGLIYIPSAGTYTFSVNSADGYQLRVGDVVNGVIGRRTAVNTNYGTAGVANYMEGYFPAEGFYPISVYAFSGGNQANLEVTVNPTTGQSILQSSRSPAANGQVTDFSTMQSGQPQIYSVTPTINLYQTGGGVKMGAKASYSVPGLGNTLIAPESWQIQKKTGTSVRGLLAEYYCTEGLNTDWYNDARLASTPSRLIQTRIDWSTQSFDGFNNLGWTNAHAYQMYGAQGVTAENWAGHGYATNGGTPLADYWGVRWTGYINVPTTGTWNMTMVTDDNSWMFVDIDGNGVFDAGDVATGNGSGTATLANMSMAAGLHKVEFRTYDGWTGEHSQIEWSGPGFGTLQDIPEQYLQVPDGYAYDTWTTLASGTGQLVDLQNGGEISQYTPTFGDSGTYRLVEDFAGQIAVAQGDFTFVPEPTTMLFLGMGLLALARRRRQKRA